VASTLFPGSLFARLAGAIIGSYVESAGVKLVEVGTEGRPRKFGSAVPLSKPRTRSPGKHLARRSRKKKSSLES
jgi:hypothetical protein